MSALPPTRTDPDLRAGSEWLGGPAGLHRAAAGFWTPLRVILLTATVTFWLGVLRTVPCAVNGWTDPDRYEHLCYSDIPILYTVRGLSDGLVPYLQWPSDGQPFEYPVLTGIVAHISAVVNGALAGTSGQSFYLITALVLFAAFLLAVAATAMTVPGRVWDGLLVALSPVVLLVSTINWDWIAVALTAVALLLWSRSRPAWAGVLLGLAIAAKFYPLLLLGPLLLLCLRAGRMRAYWTVLGGALTAWVVVNIPFALGNVEGWGYFFTASRDRDRGFGSIWLALDTWFGSLEADRLNLFGPAALVILCAGIAALILLSPRRPRLAQVSFLVVAAFLIANKVYSPQFVLWLLPLAVLARPRWRAIIWWQIAEVVHIAATWWHLLEYTDAERSLGLEWYSAAILLHVGATVVLAGYVIRDILHPEHDPVRTGRPDHADDPGGGVLNGAQDRRFVSVLQRRLRVPEPVRGRAGR